MKSPRLRFMFLLLALIMIGSLSGAISQASATTYEVGVKTGDWAQYSVTAADWRLLRGTIPEPQGIVDANRTQWINMSVQSFTINTVAIVRVTQFNNGTQRTATLLGNIETGAGSLNYTVIAADLNQGDNVTRSPTAEKIQGITSTLSYANVLRETIYSSRNDTLLAGGNRLIEWRWDKATGILDELHQYEDDVTQYYEVKSAIFIQIARTNLWEGGTANPNNSASRIDPTLPIIGGATVVAAILAVYAITHKPKPKRNRTRRYSPKRHV